MSFSFRCSSLNLGLFIFATVSYTQVQKQYCRKLFEAGKFISDETIFAALWFAIERDIYFAHVGSWAAIFSCKTEVGREPTRISLATNGVDLGVLYTIYERRNCNIFIIENVHTSLKNIANRSIGTFGSWENIYGFNVKLLLLSWGNCHLKGKLD